VPLLHDCKCAEAGLYTDFVSEEKANFIILRINVGEVPQKETATEPAEDFSTGLDPARLVRPETFKERERFNLALIGPGVFDRAGNI
jgi:hypothetical protein